MVTRTQLSRAISRGNEQFLKSLKSMMQDLATARKAQRSEADASRERLSQLVAERQLAQKKREQHEASLPEPNGLVRMPPRLGGSAMDKWQTQQAHLLLQERDRLWPQRSGNSAVA